MKITLIEAVEAHEALKAIKEANELPILIAWAMGDWFAELAPMAQRYGEQHGELAKKFGKPDPARTDQIIIEPAKIEAFTVEREKLNAIEVSLNGQKKLKLDELTAADVKIPPAANLTAMRLFIQ